MAAAFDVVTPGSDPGVCFFTKGIATAARVCRVVAGCVLVLQSLLWTSPSIAEMDQRTRSSMQDLYRSLLIAEHNLETAIKQRDFPRVRLVNNLLWNLTRLNGERGAAVNPCLEALEGISSVAGAAAFRIHPIVYGNPWNRDREEMRYSEEMRPSDDLIRKWFDQGLSDYRSKIAACEDEIGVKRSSRFLSGDLPKQAR
jgi:hypothetical protein